MKLVFFVDGFGRRIAKRVGGQFSRAWLYQDQLRPASELTADGVLTHFVYTDPGPGGAPDLMYRAGVPHRLVKDHLGSVRLVVNAQTGTIAQRLDYDEFGNVLLDTNPGFQPFGFAGRLYDPDTKLVRFGARDYDPQTGRWTAKDPIGFAGGDANVYRYALGNPTFHVDPTGLDVYVCRGDAENRILNALGVQHQWLKTTKKEAGVGGTYWSTLVEDHSGFGVLPGNVCAKVHNVDEDCVDREIKLGEKLGPWFPLNSCVTWALRILNSCSYPVPPGGGSEGAGGL